MTRSLHALRSPRLAAAALTTAALGAPAWAQDAPDGFDAHDFYLAPQDGDPRDPLRAFRPGRFEQGDAYAAGAIEAADSVLRRVDETQAGSVEIIRRESEIRTMLTTNVAAGVAPHERIRLDAAAPTYMYTAGATPDATEPATVGDLRLSSQLAVLRPDADDEGLGFGVVPWVTVPTGDEDTFRGKESVSGGLLGNVSTTLGRVTLTANAGGGFNPDIQSLNIRGRDELRAGAGVGTLLSDDIGLTVEGRVESPLRPALVVERRTPVEGLMSLRGRTDSGVHWLAGASAGFSRAVGAPEWRAFVGGGFGRAQDPDADLDGIIGRDDLCPEAPEPINGYRDDDGCPDELATATITATWGGQPAPQALVAAEMADGTFHESTGGELLLVDQMPGSQWSLAGARDCLGAAERATLEPGGQRIELELTEAWDAALDVTITDPAGAEVDATLTWLDAEPAACAPARPMEVPGTALVPLGAGSHRILVTAPDHQAKLVTAELPRDTTQPLALTLGEAKVHVTEDQLVLDERVHFAFDKATIRPISYPLLDEVAANILATDDIESIEIEGHADERGTRAYNRALSRRRAQSVREYLIDAGVGPERLKTKAHGEADPAIDRSTPAAWRANRRVQFDIVAMEATQ